MLAPQNLAPGFLAGAYLSAVNFSGGVKKGPAIACVLDGGNLTHVGPVAAYQLLSIFGTNLGPATGVAAPDGTDTSIAGVSITFDGIPAQLLYVSASQINVAVPSPALPSSAADGLPSAMVMQLTVNGVTLQRQFPHTESNMNLFADLSPAQVSCPDAAVIGNPIQPVALNADGSANSCANPAKYGSTVSFFMHGVGGDAFGFQPPQQLGLHVQAFAGFCSITVTNASLIDNFVYKVDVTMPASPLPCGQASGSFAVTFFDVTFSYDGLTVGPLYVPFMNIGPTMNLAMPMTVWVTN